MRKLILPLLALVLFCSHDMLLRLDDYFLPPNTFTTIQLLNGTFTESENTIDRDRMADVSLLGNGQRSAVPAGQWMEDGNITLLHFKTGEPGTWVAGVSTKPRDFAMDAEAFNGYLEHDGITNVLEDRQNDGSISEPAVERYSKHVKTIFQVGDLRTDDWNSPLGYPVEFIPLVNPYDLTVGDELPVRLLRKGEPLAGQLVYADSEVPGHGHRHDEEHSHDGDEPHHHDAAVKLVTDQEGRVSVPITNPGTWYIRTIDLLPSTEDSLTHESNWATLTFGVRGDSPVAAGEHAQDGENGHSHDGGAVHSHGEEAHAHEESTLPAYVWWGGSLLLITALFLYFNRKT